MLVQGTDVLEGEKTFQESKRNILNARRGREQERSDGNTIRRTSGPLIG